MRSKVVFQPDIQLVAATFSNRLSELRHSDKLSVFIIETYCGHIRHVFIYNGKNFVIVCSQRPVVIDITKS